MTATLPVYSAGWLARSNGGRTARWVSTGLFQPQLDGLGGASDYRQLRDEDVAEWQGKLG